MPAAIETNGDQAAFVAARIPGWHRLGQTFDRDLTAEDVLVEAHLGGWDVAVDKDPVRNNAGQPIPRKYGINRTNPWTGQREPLGVAGRIWRPIQNEECLPILDGIAGIANGRYETAGSIDDGRTVFVTMKLPEGMLIGGVDPVDRYLSLLNYHDATAALTLLDTPVRVVCANTVAAALSSHAHKATIWHTEGAKHSIAELRAKLDITFAYDAALADELERMIQAPCRESDFVRGIHKIWPVPDESSKRAAGNHKRRQLDLVSLFLESETNKAIRGTKWGAYNAVTEYLDWYTPVIESARRNPDVVRATRTVKPGSDLNVRKEAAFATFRVPVPAAHKAAAVSGA
jgi:phage/plasmid-like protein (TIGR03299 family)